MSAEFPPCEATRKALFDGGASPAPHTDGPHHSKVTVVGVGSVGMACAYSIVNQGLCSEMALVDVAAEKLRGEKLDLEHGKAFLKQVTIKASTDYSVSAGSNLVVITAGVRQHPGESRLDLVGRNLAIFQKIVPQLVRHSPHATLCVVSNPCDIMSWVTWKLSGLPRHRVFGSGTALDSSRFRGLIADRLGVSTQSVHGYVLGEHGDSSVAAWSGLTVGGVRLATLNSAMGSDDDPEAWVAVHHAVIRAAGEVINAKGYTSWAIGATVAAIVQSVLRDERRVFPLSVCVQGLHGIEEEVFLSLPATLGRNGIAATLNVPLSAPEADKLRHSARTIYDVQKSLPMTE